MNTIVDSKISLSADISKVINFALNQNGFNIVHEIIIDNQREDKIDDVILKINSDSELFMPYEKNISMLANNEKYGIIPNDLKINLNYLFSISERIKTNIHIGLYNKDNDILCEYSDEITVLSYNEWQGALFYPESIAAFVTPNHPEIQKLLFKASELLKKWTGDPSIDAYQSNDINRVRMQAAAIYGAIQERNIVYAQSPASFEIIGQKIRLCEDIFSSYLANCIEMTLLYSACLEAAGLYPLIVLIKGHAFAGLWLEKLNFTESISDDCSTLTKRLDDGLSEIAVVECTGMKSGDSIDFEAAVKYAVGHLQNADDFEYVVDVHRARMSGIKPIPLRVMTDSGWEIVNSVREESDLTAAPSTINEKINVVEGDVAPLTKKAMWERKLLDLGLRNNLINMRITKNVIPIFTHSLSLLEDAVFSGNDFGILPKPQEWGGVRSDNLTIESLSDIGSNAELIQLEFENKRLRTSLTEGELSKSIVGLYRNAKVALEENGANSLFLALGVLRWYESDVSKKERYAPIILVPVDIVRKSALKGYVIRIRDEETQMNVTLLEMLKQDFGIAVSGLDPLPTDDCGTDVRAVMSIMRHAVMTQSRWDVVESAFLGIFSFSQFVMWNDIKNRSDELEKNALVKSLVDGKLTWNAQSMDIGEKVDEDSIMLPMPADASQMYAIKAANENNSFVLHGPPGTGKSQTITSIIANAVANGKTVLFVAEKMAALSVVYKRLGNLGIAPFCLELHSNKSKKKDVLEQLKTATEITRNTPAVHYSQKAAEVSALRKELDVYGKELHKKQVSGLSLFEMISGYTEYEKADDSVKFGVEANNFTADNIHTMEVILSNLVAAAKDVGDIHNHELSYISGINYSQSAKENLVSYAQNYKKSVVDLKIDTDNSTKYFNEFGIEIVTDNDLLNVEKICNAFISIKEYPCEFTGYEDMNTLIRNTKKTANDFMEAQRLKSSLSENYAEQFFSLDGFALSGEYKTAQSSWFLPKLTGTNKLVKKLTPYAKGKIDKQSLGNDLEVLTQYNSSIASAEKYLELVKLQLGKLFAGDDTNWKYISEMANTTDNAAAIIETYNNSMRTKLAGNSEIYSVCEKFLCSLKTMQDSYNAFSEFITISKPESDWYNSSITLSNGIISKSDMLKEWSVYRNYCNEAYNNNLSTVVNAYEDTLSHDDVLPAFYKALYKALINVTIDSNSVLNGFSGNVFSERIEQYKQLDKQILELSKQEIYCKLAAKVPDFTREASNSSELGVLQSAIRSGGRGTSVRKLFETIPNLLPRLCPCMLMSPISAAQYLSPNREPFDIVIFDEASQLPTCKAIGAIARGRNCIIVGDPNQMPPTSFFSGNSVDEDNLENEDLESVLDDCLALCLPETHLLWHYRSRHESLIAFSNNQFYQNKLYTFPSVNDLESKVSLVRTNGVFDRGKTRQNEGEAKAVVAEIVRRYKDPELRKLSIGVVTFNISQQNLIDDLFNAECKNDNELEALAYNSDEPLFIKNLENVQGDERDVILFSVGYGPDKDGKLYMNFGPLNRDGGWRRLNVAVSRSRYEMIVFSTLRSEDINLSKSNAKGVASLKAFLEYAEYGNLANQSETASKAAGRNYIAESISCELKARGYDTQINVGNSECKVDIGVVDLENPSRYKIGILLDGNVYVSSKSTRDREISQISVLNGLGWNLIRVWSVEWIENSNKVIEKIINAINNAETPAKNDTPDVVPVSDTIEYNSVIPSDVNLNAAINDNTLLYNPVYKQSPMTADEFITPEKTRILENLINDILEKEAPISDDLLKSRLMNICEISRAGSRIQSRLFDIIKRMNVKYTEHETGKIYWTQNQIPTDYTDYRKNCDSEFKRDSKDIPPEEAANAVVEVISEQIGLPHDDLVREVLRKLGYRSTSVSVKAAVSGIEYALKIGKITVNDNYYTGV